MVLKMVVVLVTLVVVLVTLVVVLVLMVVLVLVLLAVVVLVVFVAVLVVLLLAVLVGVLWCWCWRCLCCCQRCCRYYRCCWYCLFLSNPHFPFPRSPLSLFPPRLHLSLCSPFYLFLHTIHQVCINVIIKTYVFLPRHAPPSFFPCVPALRVCRSIAPMSSYVLFCVGRSNAGGS